MATLNEYGLQKVVNKKNSKDRQEFLSICRLCNTHPLSTGNSLTIGDWSFEWSIGASCRKANIQKALDEVHYLR